MTQLLIVDDDPRQLRLLSRLFCAADPSLALETCTGAAEAIEQLQAKAFDVVLTDIQMPGMDGLELAAWLLSNQPELPVFTMTAYPDADATDRLNELGCIECFTKPLDVHAVLRKLTESLANGVQGHIRNFSLISFLQLVEMEQKTCTLSVVSSGRKGDLYFDRGQLIDAKTGDLRGDEAAMNIVAWGSPAITILASCGLVEPTITASVSFILMEAMRIQDEASQSSMDAITRFEEEEEEAEADTGAGAEAEAELLDREPERVPSQFLEEKRSASPTTPDPIRRSSDFPPGPDRNVDLLVLVRLSTGEAKVVCGRHVELTPLAQLGAAIYDAERETARQLDASDSIQELVVTTDSHGTLVRPLAHDPERVIVLVFDPKRGNLAMRRGDFDTFVADLRDWVLGGQRTP